MVDLKVEEMHCEKCVSRISGVLSDCEIEFNVDLQNKIVSVSKDKVETAISELDDIGFDSVIL